MKQAQKKINSNSKANRLQIRVDEESYKILEKASQYNRESLSRFVREASLKKAKHIIQQHESIQLSSNDWNILIEALTNPPKPSDTLKRAYRSYKEKT